MPRPRAAQPWGAPTLRREAHVRGVHIDIVGADRATIAKELFFVSSIKSLEQSPLDRHDVADLHRRRAALTDVPLPVVAVSHSGVDRLGLDPPTAPAICCPL